MNHQTKPLVKSRVLIFIGGLLIIGVTLLGLSSNHADIIREDVRMGPMIAALRIILPMFVCIGLIYFLANVKKCTHCGKIMFWKRRTPPHS
ncbi:MAG: hypothetical protein HQL84_14950 [Magnetococcales bacterium]|nr:hypothetical protein [Magnetococcales bacterium]MBF0151317.1 hypothetical protein [Magnetococcales bacterium]MBF0174223.1 hypothetical protein [Magnetococcales bacterium]MBF0347254.1 hypothetical protein [Magnetococcales bacterium]MBF0632220.1 hypothetical protein [Magnetococcales bacterium]